MKVIAVASPNHNARPKGVKVDTIVVHCDASADAQASVSWIKSPESKVSYHVLIDRDGTCYRFVETTRRAWHAGKSSYGGVDDVNDFSLGLSFANKNDGKELYTDAQYESGALVILGWMHLHPALSLGRITTHEIIRDAWLAKHPGDAEKKHDPGPQFDMDRLIGLCQQPPDMAA